MMQFPKKDTLSPKYMSTTGEMAQSWCHLSCFLKSETLVIKNCSCQVMYSEVTQQCSS